MCGYYNILCAHAKNVYRLISGRNEKKNYFAINMINDVFQVACSIARSGATQNFVSAMSEHNSLQ